MPASQVPIPGVCGFQFSRSDSSLAKSGPLISELQASWLLAANICEDGNMLETTAADPPTLHGSSPRCDPSRGRRRCRAQDPGVAIVPHATPG